MIKFGWVKLNKKLNRGRDVELIKIPETVPFKLVVMQSEIKHLAESNTICVKQASLSTNSAKHPLYHGESVIYHLPEESVQS